MVRFSGRWENSAGRCVRCWRLHSVERWFYFPGGTVDTLLKASEMGRWTEEAEITRNYNQGFRMLRLSSHNSLMGDETCSLWRHSVKLPGSEEKKLPAAHCARHRSIASIAPLIDGAQNQNPAPPPTAVGPGVSTHESAVVLTIQLSEKQN